MNGFKNLGLPTLQTIFNFLFECTTNYIFGFPHFSISQVNDYLKLSLNRLLSKQHCSYSAHTFLTFNILFLSPNILK